MPTINSHKNHYTNNFTVINQINKHKGKIYDHCKYTLIIIKKIHNYIKRNSHPSNIKFFICLFNLRMINLSFDELRLLAQIRNISNYESKSKEDLIKAFSEPKPEKTKPENIKNWNTKT